MWSEKDDYKKTELLDLCYISDDVEMFSTIMLEVNFDKLFWILPFDNVQLIDAQFETNYERSEAIPMLPTDQDDQRS